MKWILAFACLMLSLHVAAQKRTAIFKVDLKGNPGNLKPEDVHMHVRETIDRDRFLKPDGTLDEEKYSAATAGKLDTNIALNPEFSFALRDLLTGSSYSFSIYFRVPLAKIPDPAFSRLRSSYQSFKINTWTFQYRLAPPPFCAFDITLGNSTCPKCHRSDKALPLLYESIENDSQTIATYPVRKSHKAFEQDNGCSANWYCERDRITF